MCNIYIYMYIYVYVYIYIYVGNPYVPVAFGAPAPALGTPRRPAAADGRRPPRAEPGSPDVDLSIGAPLKGASGLLQRVFWVPFELR